MIRPKSATPKETISTPALPLSECLAKTYGEKENKLKGRDVLTHCQIVGEVARELIKRMPKWLSEALFPKGSILVVACHDVGKINPPFQEKIYRGVTGYKWNSIPELKTADPKLETDGGHAAVSFITTKELKISKFIPEIVGQHHGYSPKIQNLANDPALGGKEWQQRREELIDELKKRLDCDFPEIENQEHSLVLAGLTSVSDWIGSQELFDNPNDDWEQQGFIQKAVDEAGFVQPQIVPDLTFFDIFEFEPRDSQTKLFESTTQAGVYILEAPMGLGKTEAALYAAYQLLVTNKATGIYFALPTQLTSDKIYDRVNDTFLNKILSPDSPHREAFLAHGNAWLKQTNLGENANPDGVWFDERKRKLLAPFAVGTIDQALMAVMNVKHGFVRTFGLAGKVVILDEVHSYDSYTGTILDELVKALRKLHCTVIILSATLTKERREKLLAQTVTQTGYPLISAEPNDCELKEFPVEPLENKNVEIRCCQLEAEAIEEVLERAEQGQQVLWIENTVAEAQAKFSELSERANGTNVETGLLHSRFLKIDREEKENYWVDLYGKDNRLTRQIKGRILVGTQILQESVDLDSDFLVSRFAPTDMLLQRIGRLWRHEKSVRPDLAKREAWLLTPELNTAIQNAEKEFGNSAKVYAPYVLCRSLEVWHDLKSVDLPSDIRNLIEATYAERDEQNEMQSYKTTLEDKCKKLKQEALYGVSKGGTTLPESFSTRYSEQDTVPVLLLRDYQIGADSTEITLLSDEKLSLPRHIKKQRNNLLWRELAAQLLKNTLYVAIHQAPQAVSTKELDWLKEFMYLGSRNDENSFLRVAIVDKSGEIRSLTGGAASDKYQLNYDKRLGYRVEK